MRSGPAVRTSGSDPEDDGSIPSTSADRESPNLDGHRALNADDAGSIPASRALLGGLECLDCYVMQGSGHAEACWRHMSTEQREDFDRLVLELARRPHPMLAMFRRQA